MGETITRESLRKYKGWKMRVESDKEQIARARSAELFPAMRESDGSQHQTGTGDRMVNAANRRMELEEKLGPRIRATEKKIQAVDAVVESIDDPLEQEVLNLRYLFDDGSVRLMKWKEVARRIYGDDEEKYLKAAQRLHDEAIVSFDEAAERQTGGNG